MIPKPLFIFAYAYGATAYLPHLTIEDNAIRDIFQKVKRRLEFLPVSNTNLEVIYKTFNYDFKRIVWFHFSGHTSSSAIELFDYSASAQSLANLVGTSKQLSFVFLNGCSSDTQVALLFEKGVQMIIATADAIDDQKASFFSTKFYEEFINGRTIEQAFLLARDQLSIKYGIDKEHAFFRGIGKKQDNAPTNETQLWGLYTQNENLLHLTFNHFIRRYYLQLIKERHRMIKCCGIVIILFCWSWLFYLAPKNSLKAIQDDVSCEALQGFINQYQPKTFLSLGLTSIWIQNAQEELNRHEVLILGSWKNDTESDIIWTFRKDKYFESTYQGEGTWSINEEDEIIIQWAGDTTHTIWKIDTLNCDQLSLKHFDDLTFSKSN